MPQLLNAEVSWCGVILLKPIIPTLNISDKLEPNLMADRHINEHLHQHVLPTLQQHCPGIILVHDNAPSHRAIWSRNTLVNADVNVMTPLTAISSDLNLIEHLWYIIDCCILTLPRQPQTPDELILVWVTIPQAQIWVLIQSMRWQCNAVITARGGHTHCWDCYFHLTSLCENICHNTALRH